MKILWVKSDLLHPTTKGGHIRTLEMLKRIATRHEVHYAAFDEDPASEGKRFSSEYCSRVYTVPHRPPARTSPAFAAQLARGVFSRLPVSIFRYRSAAMASLLSEIIKKEKFDSIVCDFVTPAINFPALSSCVVFEHNVETVLWRRHAQNARNQAERAYLQLQARRMFRYEGEVCRAARHVIAVSREDACQLREMFGIEPVSFIPTGVDVDYFTPRQSMPRDGLVFVGSMDWLPNIDGMRWFCQEILPLIRARRADCPLSIVGRNPSREILKLADRDPLIEITGTVPDVRPWLWKAALSIVPLRIGGGTRMKIYEAMAAGTPVVSTTIGAEGLEVNPQRDICIADDPPAFAERCLELLGSEEIRNSQAAAAWSLVEQEFGWDKIARRFEAILEKYRA
jgi:sugar transferase (PEP-CTERM/EpsH1 system associated)